jgi:hypothetical protein
MAELAAWREKYLKSLQISCENLSIQSEDISNVNQVFKIEYFIGTPHIGA